MAYTKTIWIDDDTPISATNMNNIEDKIESLATVTEEIATQAEAEAGVVDNKYVTPLKLKQAIDINKAVSGMYTGDGTSNRTISLGFTPSAVLVVKSDGHVSSLSGNHGGLAVTGNNTMAGSSIIVGIVSGGFIVRSVSESIATNDTGQKYHYVAWR